MGECQLCHRMTAGMETVGCKFRGRVNVARINKETYGEKTGRRFELGLDNTPNIIYFRLGKMYTYQINKFDPESMSNFINLTAGQIMLEIILSYFLCILF